MKLNTKKITIILIACLILGGFALSFFHHHDDGLEHHDCVVCHLVQAVKALAILAAVFLVRLVFAHFLPFDQKVFVSTSLPSNLLARAPPHFS